MEKLVFVFRRKAGQSRQAFHEHYVQNHSPLGLRLQANLSGYTVNHLLSEAEFDTVTEIWTPSARAFAGGGSQAIPASEEIVADHVSFMGPQDCYIVEERIVRDGPLDPPLGQPGTRRKVVSFHAQSEPLPAPTDSAVRVVDNVVREPLYLRDQRVADGSHSAGGVAVIRTSWFEESDAAEMLPDAVAVREYRYRAADGAG
jgi:uncharacterized protein (TIGR02118 family)